MLFNPLFDPFAETGYLGYALRGIAQRQPDRSFRASLEIRDYRYARGERAYDFMFPEAFDDADAAIKRAIGKGQQLVDELLQVMDLDAPIEL